MLDKLTFESVFTSNFTFQAISAFMITLNACMSMNGKLWFIFLLFHVRDMDALGSRSQICFYYVSTDIYVREP